MNDNAAPKWVTIAKKYIGVREIVGPKHNATILKWLKTLGSKVLGVTVNDDETPWCGTFVSQVMTEAGYAPPKVAIRASSWDAFGVPVTKPFLGAVVRFQRPGGGHVGLIVGQDAAHYRVLGGNQSNSVSETWIEKDRAVALRWPAGAAKPVIIAPMMTRNGSVSRDEA